MEKSLETETSITIDASASKVWQAITTPALIKEYLMGTQVTSSWKEGSPIDYQGEYNGTKYHDKGVIKKIIPPEILQSTYWSSAGGKEDKPENYNVVTYQLHENAGKTTVALSQDNIKSEEEKAHVTENWKAVLKELKKVVEKQ